MNKTKKQSWSKPAKLFKKVALGLAVSTALVNSAFAVEPLSVSGNRILTGGEEGQAFSGPSLFWSNSGWGAEHYWTADTVSHFKNNWGATLIRAAMGVEGGGGAADDYWTNVNRVKTIVDAAIANDMYVIVDFHTHHLPDHMGKAKEFFSHMAEEYGHHDNIIWEVYNEPLKVSWSNDIKPYAEEVIAEIRKHDPDNLVIVGTPTWSQRVDEASEDPITKFDNIAYTIHFYANFEFHQQGLIDIAQKALDNGLALMATEWGTVNANGDGPVNHEWTNKWMDFLATNGISHANWSVNNKAEGASMLWGDGLHNLTESGNLVKGVVSGWQDRVNDLYKPGNLEGSTGETGQTGETTEECKTTIKPIVGDGQNVAALSVEGNQVLIGGEKGSLAGPSLFWSSDGWGGERFYNAETVKNAKDEMGATLIRAAMGAENKNGGNGGYLADPESNADKVRTVVNAAVDNEMYVIIDWHSHDAETATSQAKEFFTQMAREYGHLNNVIYEVYNEPVHQSWGEVKSYSEQVIEAIRKEDPDNLIVVGTPFYSQNVDDASRDQINGKNIAYTLHFYAGTHGEGLRQKARTALNNGAALFATEWGTVDANGDGGVNHGETDAWMNFFRENNISHAGWALNDKGEGSSVFKCNDSNEYRDCLDPIDNKWSMLTESGSKQKDIYKSWPRPSGINNGTGGTIGVPVEEEECTIVKPTNGTLVPAKIEAEAYTSMSGIKTEDTSDTGGGENVGWTETGDSLTYAINVPAAGTYTIDFRVASMDGSSFSVSSKGQALTKVTVPNTGDWQEWTTVSKDVELEAGNQDLVITATGDGWNINWIDVTGDILPPADNDGDGILNDVDNCPAIANPGQWNKDGDEFGNECDNDIDGDGFTNEEEIAAGTKPWDPTSKPGGDINDIDGDGILNNVDNCPAIANPGQWNKDGDEFGNKCDDDIDGDTFSNAIERAEGTKVWDPLSFPVGSTATDRDGDGIDNEDDNCPVDKNAGQWDKDNDGLGNECDDDIDGDGFSNAAEIAAGTKPWDPTSNPGQNPIIDTDKDGIEDKDDNCPTKSNADQADANGNGVGDVCEPVVIQPADSPVAYYGELMAEGNQILGSITNQPAQVRGVSFFWSNYSQQFWNAGMVNRMVDEFQVELVRAAYGVDDNGSPYNSADEGKLREVVETAIDKGIYVIIDWHSHGAHKNPGAAKDFFSRMAKDYGHHDNVIFEVFNEPLNEGADGTTWSMVKDYAEDVLPVIREHSDNLVVVGTTTWAQDVDLASADPVNGDNVAYSVHFYVPNHGLHLKSKIDATMAAGNIALFATEWGFWDLTSWGSDDMTVDDWMDTMDEHKLSWANWAIADKDEKSSLFFPDGSLRTAGQWLKGALADYAQTAEWRTGNSTGGTTKPPVVTGPLTKDQLIDDLDDNDNVSFWGGEWSTYHDNDQDGASTITDKTDLVSGGHVAASYDLDQGDLEWDPYVGVSLALNSAASAQDLSACSQIQYDFKGSAHVFRAEQTNVKDFAFHSKKTSASTDWKTVVIKWAQLTQPEWATAVPSTKSKVNNFSWQSVGSTGSGELMIDNVACVGAVAP